jgi:hypothetical protein
MDPAAKPTAIGPPFEGRVKVVLDLPKGDLPAKEKTTSSSATWRDQGDTTIETNKAASPISIAKDTNSTPSKIEPTIKSEPLDTTIDINLDLRRDIFQSKKRECVSCSKQYKDGYESSKDFICPPCYHRNKLSEGSNAADYKSTSWSEQENLLLFEGLEMYPTDWQLIAQHVSTKTKEDCILHYLELPIADPRLDAKLNKLLTLSTKCNTNAHVDNPIMSVVAFLASNVTPQVAAIAADSSKVPEKDMDHTNPQQEEIKERLDAKYNLIHNKITHFSQRLQDFQSLESVVSKQRRGVEQERMLIREEHYAFKNKMDGIYQRMFQLNHIKQKAAAEEAQAAQLESQTASAAAVAQAAAAAAFQPFQEEMMPVDAMVKLPKDILSPEEAALQAALKERYPRQYMQRQRDLLSQGNALFQQTMLPPQ